MSEKSHDILSMWVLMSYNILYEFLQFLFKQIALFLYLYLYFYCLVD